MVLIDFKDCLNKGLLRKVPASKEKAIRSLQRAEEFIEKVNELI